MFDDLFSYYERIQVELGETDDYEREQMRKDKKRMTRQYQLDHKGKFERSRCICGGAWAKVVQRKHFNAGRKVA